MMNIAAALILTLSIQTAPTVEARYAKGNNSQIVALLHMSSQSDQGCTSKYYSGQIVGVRYDDGDGVEIVSFGLRLADGQRERIYLDDDFYRRVQNADRGRLHTIFRKGQRVRVKVYLCGAGGNVATAHEVTALR
ncbi:MAG TPA: hypothetical protein VD835_07730 [Pyrinomonadaceae bacterium]|nr:hypothetical protein [Pyrinomonadaceae bacterium]